MDLALLQAQSQRPLNYRAVFQERGGSKLKPFLGSFQHGRVSLFVQFSSWPKVHSSSGVSHRIIVNTSDFSRRRQRKVSTSRASGPSPKGFLPKGPAGTSTQKRDQKNEGDEMESPNSNEVSGPSKNVLEMKVDSGKRWAVENSPETELEEEESNEINGDDEKFSSVKEVSAVSMRDQKNDGDEKDLESPNTNEVSAPSKNVLEMKVGSEKRWAVKISPETKLEEEESDGINSDDEKFSLLKEVLAVSASKPVVENGSLNKVSEDDSKVQLKKQDPEGDNENVNNETNSKIGDKKASVYTIFGSVDKSGEADKVVDKTSKNDKVVDEEALKLKFELEAKKRDKEIARLAEERFSVGDKIFAYPPVVKPDEDVEVFLNKSFSTLVDEPDVLIMGAFNDWRYKSFTTRLTKTKLKGDWWSCQIHVPKEAYKMDFVFFNGQSVYDNNDKMDFAIHVEGGMDVFAFEDFLLEEKHRELEQLAKEQAEKERLAEEQRRMEAEKAAREADRAQARRETEARRESFQHLIQRAAASVENVWHIDPSNFKGNDVVRLYYNRSSGPLVHAEEIWIHGGHNNWSVGLTIVERLVKSDKEGGDWWYAKVVVPNNAFILDWVFADGPPKNAKAYDNNHNQDFHAIVRSGIPDEQYWIEQEQQICEKLQEERRIREDAVRAKAEKTARLKAETKERTLKSFLLSQKHVVYTDPLDVRAGTLVTVFYNPENTNLNGKPEVWFRGSFNRWTHRMGPLRPQKMLPVGNGSHVKCAVKVPLDAYMMDFVFSEREDGGVFDNKYGMDYHIPVFGGIANEPPMNIVHISVEMAPIAKVGGLGDVVTGLSRAIQELNHHVDIILPKFDCMNLSNVKDFGYSRSYSWGGTEIKVFTGKVEGLSVYFLEPQNGFFGKGCIYGCNNDAERFGFFCHAALEFLLQRGSHPDIIHCHDWSSAPVAWLFKDHYMQYGLSNAKVVFTIHNLEFGAHFIERAMAYSHKATTVSPTYSREVSGNPVIAPHLHKFHGIINGIDPDIWDPFNDKFIPVHYTSENVVEGKRAAKQALQERLGLARSDRPLVGIITRLTHQKGINLIKHAISRTLERNGQVVLLGSAPDPRIQNDFANLAQNLHSLQGDRARLCLTYDEPLSHLIYAGADFILVPSIFEPCGLTQLIAMRYGSIPVVRKTGGLHDTVFDVDHDKERAKAQGLEPNGFNFDGADPGGVDYALNRAISAWYEGREWFNSLCKKVMEQDWSWNRPALDYMELYHSARKIT